jgi:hypothetical protein
MHAAVCARESKTCCNTLGGNDEPKKRPATLGTTFLRPLAPQTPPTRMADSVTLEISFASGGADGSAKLCQQMNAKGAPEQQCAQVQLRATVKQETFPGHRWLLRGEQTGKVLWMGRAAARPAVQPIVVHVRDRAGDDNDEGEGDDKNMDAGARLLKPPDAKEYVHAVSCASANPAWAPLWSATTPTHTIVTPPSLYPLSALTPSLTHPHPTFHSPTAPSG